MLGGIPPASLSEGWAQARSGEIDVPTSPYNDILPSPPDSQLSNTADSDSSMVLTDGSFSEILSIAKPNKLADTIQSRTQSSATVRHRDSVPAHGAGDANLARRRLPTTQGLETRKMKSFCICIYKGYQQHSVPDTTRTRILLSNFLFGQCQSIILCYMQSKQYFHINDTLNMYLPQTYMTEFCTVCPKIQQK